MNNQKEYYKKLTCCTHPTNLKVALTYYNSKVNKYTPGRRYNHTKYELYDERNVAVNEIVFDFDWSSYKANYKQAKLIIEALNNRKIPFIVCPTGGKGIHIHTFFNKITFVSEENKELFKEALSYGLSYKHIRLWLWNTIANEAGIEDKHRGKGNKLDSHPMVFNYYSGTSHLIRAIGGRKYVKNSEDEWTPCYKTYISTEEFSSKKITVKDVNKVKYPDTVPIFNIDEYELCDFLKQFVKSQEKGNKSKLTNDKIDCKYIELDGVLKVREGLNEGQRSAGATIISIACRIDDIDKEDAYKIIQEYVDNCTKSGTNFTFEEAKQWVDWIYLHEKPFWNCQLLKDLDLHDVSSCLCCQAKNKEAIKFLTKTTMLKQIKEVLDEEIVGEDDTKLLIFLLMLSKDFPSSSGREDWNISGDPMSQNIILSSDSSSGKSWIIKKILTLIGDEEEDYFIISRITKNAINYYTDVNMDGKMIFIEELQGLDENTSQLRVWMSEGKLSLQTVEKVLQPDGTEKIDPIRKVTKGQPVFITNQAEGQIEDQLNNRSWVLSLDVSESQTNKILEFQDVVNKGNCKIDKIKKREIKDALKQLKPHHFVIPFADHKAMGIPLNDVRSRRDYQKFLTLIKCSAYLHQYQRQTYADDDGNEFIVCDIVDYDIARQYSQNVLGATFSGLTNSQIDLINYLRNCSWNQEFQISDIMRNLGKSQPLWHGMLNQLEDLGYVTADKSMGRSTVYCTVESKIINIISLPSGEELMQKITSKAPISGIAKFDENVNKISIESMINFMKMNKKHVISFNDFVEYFKIDDEIIEKYISKMLSMGDIYQNKPDSYILT